MTSKPRALITGAAQGIGYACAEALKEDGYDVILSDINEDGLAEASEKLGAAAIPVTWGIWPRSSVCLRQSLPATARFMRW